MEKQEMENFWDEMEQEYPKAYNEFKRWFNKYKEDNNWFELFNEGDADGDHASYAKSPKFKELPIAMQHGIFLQFHAEKVLSGSKENWLEIAIKDFVKSIFVTLQQLPEVTDFIADNFVVLERYLPDEKEDVIDAEIVTKDEYVFEVSFRNTDNRIMFSLADKEETLQTEITIEETLKLKRILEDVITFYRNNQKPKLIKL